MVNLNLRYFYDHYCKGSHHISVVPVNPDHGMFAVACDFAAHAILLLACVPLLGIRRLPVPLDQFPVVGFYYHQWLDDLGYVDSPRHKLRYATACLSDSVRLMINYNPLTRVYKRNKACTCQCKCECDGSCSNILV